MHARCHTGEPDEPDEPGEPSPMPLAARSAPGNRDSLPALAPRVSRCHIAPLHGFHAHRGRRCADHDPRCMSARVLGARERSKRLRGRRQLAVQPSGQQAASVRAAKRSDERAGRQGAITTARVEEGNLPSTLPVVASLDAAPRRPDRRATRATARTDASAAGRTLSVSAALVCAGDHNGVVNHHLECVGLHLWADPSEPRSVLGEQQRATVRDGYLLERLRAA